MMAFSDYPLVEQDFMNRDHTEFVECVNALEQALIEQGKQADSESVEKAMMALLAHTRGHFSREEVAMQQISFPAYSVHKAEHDRVLALLESRLGQFRQKKDFSGLMDFALEDLPAWFHHHLTTMDTVTAQFISRHQEES